MLILLSQSLAWTIFICSFVGVFLILFIILYFTCGFRKKRENTRSEHVVVDEDFMNKLLIGLGEASNILNTEIENGRIKFEVKDLELLNTEVLKELSTSGVFITGKNVKLLFKYDSKTIIDELRSKYL